MLIRYAISRKEYADIKSYKNFFKLIVEKFLIFYHYFDIF